MMGSDAKQVIVFCLVVFIVTYLIDAWLWISGGLEVWFADTVLIMEMFVPILSAVIAVKLVGHGSLKSYGIRWGKSRYYIYGYIYPFVVIALGILFVMILRTASIDLDVTVFKQMFPNIPFHLVAANFIIGSFITFIPAFGEEYGWRGFLLPKLINKIGLFNGLSLTGLIWGLWHAPSILMGYNYPNHPDFIGVAAMTFWTIFAGFFLGWLRLKSGSTFPSALSHASINTYIGFVSLIALAQDEMMTIPSGIPAILALLVIASLAYIDLSKTREQI